jgi:hypothetical protein
MRCLEVGCVRRGYVRRAMLRVSGRPRRRSTISTRRRRRAAGVRRLTSNQPAKLAVRRNVPRTMIKGVMLSGTALSPSSTVAVPGAEAEVASWDVTEQQVRGDAGPPSRRRQLWFRRHLMRTEPSFHAVRNASVPDASVAGACIDCQDRCYRLPAQVVSIATTCRTGWCHTSCRVSRVPESIVTRTSPGLPPMVTWSGVDGHGCEPVRRL